MGDTSKGDKIYLINNVLMFGGVAQWLGCQSVAGGLSLIYCTPDPWLTCDHFVGKASAMGQPTRPTQPSIPPGSVNE